ncbi:hypothetical protein MP228_013126 [Amoeboaphelidium protococcarum]|nr:hypothetical protein MP228_013126 [Amoeboaphelidium protococcarum]
MEEFDHEDSGNEQVQLNHSQYSSIMNSIKHPSRRLLNLHQNFAKASAGQLGEPLKMEFVSLWLRDNYLEGEKLNVQRHLVLHHLNQYCAHYGLPQVGPSMLGKAVKQIFPSVKIRRLGVRGHSKYHYCGIGLADSRGGQMLSPGTPGGIMGIFGGAAAGGNYILSSNQMSFQPQLVADTFPQPNALLSEQETQILSLYQGHLQAALTACIDQNITSLEVEFQSIASVMNDIVTSQTLSQSALESFGSMLDQLAIRLDATMDLYLCSQSGDEAAVLEIRKFCKSIESTYKSSTISFQGSPFHQYTLSLLSIFVQYVRRKTTLSHLGSTLNTILQDVSQCKLLQEEVLKIDLLSIYGQYCMVDRQFSYQDLCQLMSQLNNLLAGSPCNVQSYAYFVSEQLEGTADKFRLSRRAQYTTLVVRLEYLTSLILRDLTLRSSPAFGSFHILKLYTCEFLGYLIENKLCYQCLQQPQQS